MRKIEIVRHYAYDEAACVEALRILLEESKTIAPRPQDVRAATSAATERSEAKRWQKVTGTATCSR